MKRFNHILVAFDRSVDSLEALKTAETLATGHQSHMTVVYVDDSPEKSSSIYAPATTTGDGVNMTQSQPVIPGPGPMPVMPNYAQKNSQNTNMEENEADRILYDAKSHLPDTIDADFEILVGKPASELTRFANDHDVDLIVVGNRGLSGVKKLIMGSVSQKITNEAPCSVFVVK